MGGERAIRASVRGAVQGVGFRDAARRRALELGLAGWVRNGPVKMRRRDLRLCARTVRLPINEL